MKAALAASKHVPKLRGVSLTHARTAVSVHEQCTNTCTRRTVIPQSSLHFILSARPQHANNWESYPLDRVSAAPQEVP